MKGLLRWQNKIFCFILLRHCSRRWLFSIFLLIHNRPNRFQLYSVIFISTFTSPNISYKCAYTAEAYSTVHLPELQYILTVFGFILCRFYSVIQELMLNTHISLFIQIIHYSSSGMLRQEQWFCPVEDHTIWAVWRASERRAVTQGTCGGYKSAMHSLNLSLELWTKD